MFPDQLKLAGERSIPITIVVLLVVLGSSGRGRASRSCSPCRACSPRSAWWRSRARSFRPTSNVNAVILLIGLAVGVDYSLFYIKRWREERAAGREPTAALAAAAATSGRSGADLRLHGADRDGRAVLRRRQDLLSFGIATMIVVAVAMLGSLTVLPALLSKLGARVDKGRIPFVHRFRNDASGSRSGRRSSRPHACSIRLVAAVLAGGLLLALALPAFQLHTAQSGLEALPTERPDRRPTIQRIAGRVLERRRDARDRRDRGEHRFAGRRSRRSRR